MQDFRPTISVVTICYNAADDLERTIHSVIGQTYDKVEYIIIDGGSGDRTPEVLHRYSDRVDRVISEPDSGIYDAMNKGLKHATGDYVCFMNAGDCFHSEHTLKRALSGLSKAEALPTVVYGETNLVDRDGNFLRERRLKAPAHLEFKDFMKGMLVCHQSFYALREIAPLYDLQYRFSSDVDWCLNILKQKGKTHNTHQVLTDYLSEGVTTNNRWPSLKERFRIMRKHYGLGRTLWAHLYIAGRAIVLR